MNLDSEIWIKLEKSKQSELEEEEEWLAATVLSVNTHGVGGTKRMSIQIEGTGEVREVDLATVETKLRHYEDRNVSDIEDLTILTHLCAPSILATLEARYLKKAIYTYTGSILIAINPYENLQSLYSSDQIQAYYEHYEQWRLNDGGSPNQSDSPTSSMTMPPHVYALAARAYHAMIHPPPNAISANQSILISGESGAGKTESTKFIMQYLVSIGSDEIQRTSQSLRLSRKSILLSESDLALKILEVNPLLESFGNARTLHNDNSSRFGKFIRLHFHSNGKLLGASIQTYLLEKVRVVSQAKNERNYHIFYEMCNGANEEERREWKTMAMTKFRYLNQNHCYTRKDSHTATELNNEEGSFRNTLRALEQIGFTDSERNSIFKLLSSILYLGNLEFHSLAGNASMASTNASIASLESTLERSSSLNTASTDATEIDSDCTSSLEAAAALLSIPKHVLETGLCSRNIRAGSDSVNVPLSPEQASYSRDAFSKALYSHLFDWLVDKINRFLKCALPKEGRHLNVPSSTPAVAATCFIGILDIFGFEIFPRNSFEQLCINYANETLQQQFNEYVFEMEQVEYQKEHVDWKYVEFPSNHECVNLIGQRHVGILSLIDEACMIPKNTDTTLAYKLYQKWSEHERFEATRVQQARGLFVIKHYAGPVTYCTEGFLEKNKDHMHQEAIDLLMSSHDKFLQELFQKDNVRAAVDASLFEMDARGHGSSKSSALKQRRISSATTTSVALQFKSQLAELMSTIRSTSPHFVRCMTPNDKSLRNHFDRDRVSQQLQCNGILEAVRVSRSGYSVRMSHAEFIHRYSVLKIHLKQQLVSKIDTDTTEFTANRMHSTEAIKRRVSTLLQELVVSLPKISRRPSFARTNPGDEANSVPIKAHPPIPKTTIHSVDITSTVECLNQEVFVHVGIQQGLTKVFLRTSVFDTLEKWRNTELVQHRRRVQGIVLTWYSRMKYVAFLSALRVLQCRHRLFLSRRRQRRCNEERMQSEAAAVQIQSHFRVYRGKAKYRIELQHQKKLADQAKLLNHANRRIEKSLEENRREPVETKPVDASVPSMHSLDEVKEFDALATSVVRKLSGDANEAKFTTKGHRQDETIEHVSTASANAAGQASHHSAMPLSSVPKILSFHAPEGQQKENVIDDDDDLKPRRSSSHGRFSGHSMATSRSSSGFSMSSFEPPADANDDDDLLNGQLLNSDYDLNLHDSSGATSSLNDEKRRQKLEKENAAVEYVSNRATRVVNLPKLGSIQAAKWVNDKDRFSCHVCNNRFNVFRRKHHCRSCGEVICGTCSIYHKIDKTPVRVCKSCVAFHAMESPPTQVPQKTWAHEGHSSESSGSETWNNAWPEPPRPLNEKQRLQTLRRIHKSSYASEGIFNMFCDVAARTLKCPMSAVSIIEEDEQILVANMGMSQESLPRELSFCSYTICENQPLVILDTKLDERFQENPMVQGAVQIRFYAGAAIFSSNGHAIGSVFVMDTKPRRQVDAEHVAVLQNLSALASEKMMKMLTHPATE